MESRQTDTLTAFPDKAPDPAGTGARAVSVAGHFGEWLQGRLGREGPVALVTVRCAALRVRAEPGARAAALPFDAQSLAAFRKRLGLPDLPWPALRHDMPLGGGAGGSTATLVALALALGFRGSPEALAAACVEVEGASDPLMLPGPDRVLWASREGRALRHLAPPPACAVLGGFWGAPERTDPGDARFADIADLARDWERAAGAGDLAAASRVASMSAERCTAERGPGDPMAELARALGAAGHLRAHTGSARGLIFPPGGVPEHGAALLREAGLTGVLQFATGGR